jgi:hypothetical protein
MSDSETSSSVALNQPFGRQVLLSRHTCITAIVKCDTAVTSLGFSDACKVALNNVETFVFDSQLSRFGIYTDLIVKAILVELVRRSDRVLMVSFVCKMINCGGSRALTASFYTLEVLELIEVDLLLSADFLVRKD